MIFPETPPKFVTKLTPYKQRQLSVLLIWRNLHSSNFLHVLFCIHNNIEHTWMLSTKLKKVKLGPRQGGIFQHKTAYLHKYLYIGLTFEL